MKESVRALLKQMQRRSNSVDEYIELCTKYETYEFQKLQEVELYYMQMKKYYLSKSFSKELSVKLENNRFTSTPSSNYGKISDDSS